MINLRFKFVCLFLIIFHNCPLPGQSGHQPVNSVVGKEYIDSLIIQSNSLIQLDKESAVSFARQALQHSQRINYESGIAGAKEMIGMYQASISDYPGALESFFAFLDIVKKLGDQSAEVRGFLRISGVYMKIRNSQMAYKYVQDAILLANNLQKTS